MIVITHKGDFSPTTKFLTKALQAKYDAILRRYGEEGVRRLSEATPVDTGRTASSWSYSVDVSRNGSAAVSFSNSNVVKGVPIALILQYGHGTRNGGYVQGRDYINPALRPVFDEMAESLWKEVTGK